MLAGKSWEEWIQQYAQSHQHPANRFCHTLGIPLIAVSLPLFVVAFVLGAASTLITVEFNFFDASSLITVTC